MKTNPTANPAADPITPAERIDAKIATLTDWRGHTLARIRTLIKQATLNILEEWKWDLPVWSHAGIICTRVTLNASAPAKRPRTKAQAPRP